MKCFERPQAPIIRKVEIRNCESMDNLSAHGVPQGFLEGSSPLLFETTHVQFFRCALFLDLLRYFEQHQRAQYNKPLIVGEMRDPLNKRPPNE